mmetsp:Transcript_32810/g.52589  ORF Transcript_32810/g.52589 Transcript_32810/m.52589 type:complete len:637 (+) Transcript_32810:208-2118(+)
MAARALRFALLAGVFMAAKGALELETDVPIVRIAASAAEADPANNVIAPIAGDRASCLAYVAGEEASLPASFDAERGIDTLSPGYYKRLARTLTHLKAMVAAYRLDAPAVLILDEQEHPVRHPRFEWTASLDTFVRDLPPGWQHVQLSVLALSDSFGVLVQDWEAQGRPSTLQISAQDRARPNTELWSYGAYLVSKTGLANTLLTYSNRHVEASGASSGSGSEAKTLKFDLSRASCVEADNCLLWEGVHGKGWFVATPPLLAAGAQVTYDEADAVQVEVAVSELIKENMYHVQRWWQAPDALLADAKLGALSLPTAAGLDEVMKAVGIKPVSVPVPAAHAWGASKSASDASSPPVVSVTSAEKAVADGSRSSGAVGGKKHAGESLVASAAAKDTGAVSASQKSSGKKSARQSSPSGAKSHRVPSSAGDIAPPATEPSREKEKRAGDEDESTMPPAEAAAAKAAGITHTQSAFEYGRDLWTQAWGAADQQGQRASSGSEDAGVAAVGGEVEIDQDEVANMLDQYKSEKQLADAHASSYIQKRSRASAALGAWRDRGDVQGRTRYPTAALGSALRGEGSSSHESASSSTSAPGGATHFAIAAGAVAALTASAVVAGVAALTHRRQADSERAALVGCRV